MGLILIGFGLLAGFGLAAWLRTPAASAPPSTTQPTKVQVGAMVASFPHAQWGQVTRVNGDCYTVKLNNGPTVELRGQELTS
jgi:hypothetical protein